MLLFATAQTRSEDRVMSAMDGDCEEQLPVVPWRVFDAPPSVTLILSLAGRALALRMRSTSTLAALLAHPLHW